MKKALTIMVVMLIPAMTVAEAVNQPPVLNSIGEQNTTEGVSLLFMVYASDAESIPILTTSILITGSGNFTDNGNGTGYFYWTPGYTESGTYFVTFYATDDSLSVDSEIVTIIVVEKSDPIQTHRATVATFGSESSIYILSFKMKTVETYPGAGLDNISFMVKVFNSLNVGLEICISVKDRDDFVLETFCRSERKNCHPELFHQKGDTTIFNYPRLVNDATEKASISLTILK